VSQENIELMRRGYDAWLRRDLGGMLSLLDPDVEVHDRPEAPDARSYRGHEGVLTALQVSLDAFEDFRLVPERFYDAGDKVVVRLRMIGTGNVSGVPVEEHIAHLWTIRDGRAVALQVYSDPADALTAAGLPESEDVQAEPGGP
jgi:ketosteroid isomerase-like protein